MPRFVASCGLIDVSVGIVVEVGINPEHALELEL